VISILLQAFGRKVFAAATIVASIGVLSPIPGVAQSVSGTGAVFVMTNAADNNQIIAYSRDSDGKLTDGDRFDTGGRGSGGLTAPLGSQGSLTLSLDHTFLFAVNAGSGTISVFRVRNSKLNLMSVTPSGGSSPIAVAQRGDLVYVVNAGGQGSVVSFRLESNERLEQIDNATVFLTTFGGGAGGSSIAISPDGRFLLVIERIAGNLDAIPVNADGSLGSIVRTPSFPGAFTGIFTLNGDAIVAQAGTASTSAVSSYSLNETTGSFSPISSNEPTQGAATCWSVLTPDGTRLFTSNTGSSTVSEFDVDESNGTVSSIVGASVASTNPTGGTNLDIAVSSDGNFLFTIDSSAGAISTFDIRGGGFSLASEVAGLPQSVGFQGIAAY
jgi:6-phosphogluconolactonase